MRIICLAFLVLSCSVSGQENKRGTIKVQKVQPITNESQLAELSVGQMPMFKGGDGELLKFIKKNMKYPEGEKKAGKQGTVVVRFTVGTDGRLFTFKVMSGVAGAPAFEEEAIRLVSIMPNWTPGIKNNQIVGMTVNLPIKFTL